MGTELFEYGAGVAAAAEGGIHIGALRPDMQVLHHFTEQNGLMILRCFHKAVLQCRVWRIAGHDLLCQAAKGFR